MKEIAAYALLVLGGNAAPDAAAIKAVIAATGAEAEEEKITQLLEDLKDKDIHELLAKGEEQLKACVGSGGGGGGGGAAPAAGGGAAPEAAKAPEKPKEEEVDALAGGMDMFGGGGAKTGDY